MVRRFKAVYERAGQSLPSDPYEQASRERGGGPGRAAGWLPRADWEHLHERRAGRRTCVAARSLSRSLSPLPSRTSRPACPDLPPAPALQMKLAINAVFGSWNTPRAVKYRCGRVQRRHELASSVVQTLQLLNASPPRSASPGSVSSLPTCLPCRPAGRSTASAACWAPPSTCSPWCTATSTTTRAPVRARRLARGRPSTLREGCAAPRASGRQEGCRSAPPPLDDIPLWPRPLPGC